MQAKTFFIELGPSIGNLEMIQFLLRNCNGTDVNTVSGDWGPTPLQYASINGHSQVTRFLLGEEDIQVNNEGGVGQTALIIAIQTSHLEVCEILLESPGGDSMENLLA